MHSNFNFAEAESSTSLTVFDTLLIVLLMKFLAISKAFLGSLRTAEEAAKLA